MLPAVHPPYCCQHSVTNARPGPLSPAVTLAGTASTRGTPAAACSGGLGPCRVGLYVPRRTCCSSEILLCPPYARVVLPSVPLHESCL